MNDLRSEEIWEETEENDWTGEYLEDEMDEVIREVLKRELPGTIFLRN